MRLNLEVLDSFDFIMTTSITQSADEHVNRNGRGAVLDISVI